jgi:hypothetical protein
MRISLVTFVQTVAPSNTLASESHPGGPVCRPNENPKLRSLGRASNDGYEIYDRGGARVFGLSLAIASGSCSETHTYRTQTADRGQRRQERFTIGGVREFSVLVIAFKDADLTTTTKIVQASHTYQHAECRSMLVSFPQRYLRALADHQRSLRQKVTSPIDSDRYRLPSMRKNCTFSAHSQLARRCRR